ncbi:LRR receptor-like serine threonine-protein kinase At4g08850-like [Seminavis robusta]|uniref:LRR receptor-like serine threonine-protein kinase At4g08850-like n=1 Tax=Seminavis robusta TaxID=568900 RepID=A0A9N8E6X6_9STRA|nr:LRR receptor-like serine threonine-protein kinase At4g08850-like [Seminavis robusta]|eukprot:Sro716_g191920.1 LRR receptor-like serine threonine-protein kinase At4g08850-like (611) ;mRNA; r:39789-42088
MSDNEGNSVEARRKRRNQRTSSANNSSTGGRGGRGNNNNNGSGGAGRHRSFVARRFLENEDDDDLDPERLDLEDDQATNVTQSDLASQGSSRGGGGGGGGNFFEKGDRFNKIDQSVNLMDTSAATYESGRNKGKRHARPRMKKGGAHQASMVDVFLDYATDGPGQRQGDYQARASMSRGEKCRDLIFSTRFLIFATLLIVGTLFVAFTVAGGDKKEEPVKVVTSPVPEGRTEAIQAKIIDQGVTSEAELKKAKSIAHKALLWLAEADEAQLAPDSPDLIVRYVMAVLYHSTQESQWQKQDNWMTKASVCNWYGIECERIQGNKDIVVHVNLATNGLQGSIPSELKALTDLVLLDLSGNGLVGSIPEEIGQMTLLHFLRLQDNQLTGELPQSIGDLSSAEEIFLSHNKLKGPLPAYIGELVNLRGLKLDHNQLSGSLPKEWKQTKIDSLYLQSNEFKGHIPHSLFQLTTLVDFRIGNNKLTGTIPPEIESIFRLEIFEAQENELHGEVPEVFNRLHHLQEMNLHHNSIGGSLPDTLAKSTSMKRFLLDNNQITGTIPDWGGMASLESLNLHNNQLSGSVPSKMCLATASLTTLTIDCDRVTCDSPCDCKCE